MAKIDQMEFPKGIIGTKIRKLRRELGLTVDELAKKTGLSQSMVSQIENGLTNPSLDTLWKISHCLGVPVFSFFKEITSSEVKVTKREDQKLMKMLHPNVIYRILSPALDNGIEVFELIVQPGEAKHFPQLNHQGEEFGYVVEGRLEVIIEDRVFRLDTGDSIYFNSGQKHKFNNPGPEPAVGLWVMISKKQL
ncbi:helix-turn-helix domain-containing protein [Paenibacillus thermotolerans]|uniref:helix-turn-helix domain-containing protein n=1 Tax=Paenibacillus thermotolerans TaxID=3027807 RepID=UPI0023687BE7|nr:MULTISPECIES: cupin domain-containing protein [unclassified Paenibacillus]